jgi:hypothetical protein
MGNSETHINMSHTYTFRHAVNEKDSIDCNWSLFHVNRACSDCTIFLAYPTSFNEPRIRSVDRCRQTKVLTIVLKNFNVDKGAPSQIQHTMYSIFNRHHQGQDNNRTVEQSIFPRANQNILHRCAIIGESN